ncbi:winged helix-turn-helix domain-containing protein [Enterovibrio sp. ZSDZ35]|uniref:Winged helix-turn-helix domain-containing protein n=1 Tax=Enterovibrio qingdaonensis TaxID=2899818 RepID=A0ABT5QN23_9GAMM|nr:winged helix-turn-helix domain-containing protein [Enterovibrio sp. ZSDZ35]MDD1782390.1 winged helix-turn-helix domain-containing protein [Enterovibrio sp. ZSDZ35]
MLNKSNRYLLGERFVFSPSDSSLVDLHENDDLVRLGSNECRVLMVLIEEPHAIVTRNRIHDFVWRKQGFEVDDSSLTQSISTLRKALKESTKNPMFVKTVPKRGYQVVCSVEVYNDQPVDIPTPKPVIQEDPLPEPVETVSEDIVDTPDPIEEVMSAPLTPPEYTQPDPIPETTTAPPTYPKTPLSSWVAFLLALLLPVAFFVASTPKSEAFREILKVQDVPVYIPVTNARIVKWKPMVERCVDRYISHYSEGAPLEEVIVTGGQDNQISLNYIHSADDADDNVTYVVLTSEEESHSLCR